MLILLTLLAQSFALPPDVEPHAAHEAGMQAYWISASEEGGAQRLFYVTSTQTVAVPFPPDTLFWAPVEQRLLLISPEGVRLCQLKDGELSGQLRAFAQPLMRRHPPYSLPWLTLGQEQVLVLFDGHTLHIVPRQGAMRTHALPTDLAPELGEDHLRVLAEGSQLYWSNNAEAFVLAASGLSRHELASTRDMELARLITPEPTWFLHGGKSGDLNSFSWSLEEAGKTLVHGQGIVTRYGRDLFASNRRLWLFTVPASVGGQVWQALRGSTAFTCHLVSETNGRWLDHGSFEVSLKKNRDRSRPFMLDFQADLNGDGLADLIAADDKRGVRLFASRADGSLQHEGRKLASNPDALLVLPNHLLVGRLTKKGWQLERLP